MFAGYGGGSTDTNDDNFIADIIGLQRHYDDRVQYARHMGGVIHFSGFATIKVGEVERIARQYGKRATYHLLTGAISAEADVNAEPVTPLTAKEFATAHNKRMQSSPRGGATRRHVLPNTSVLTSSNARNLLAHPQTLDVWGKTTGEVIITVVPPSQRIGGLSARAEQHLPSGTKSRCRRPRYCGKSRRSKPASGRWSWASLQLFKTAPAP